MCVWGGGGGDWCCFETFRRGKCLASLATLFYFSIQLAVNYIIIVIIFMYTKNPGELPM